ncbi:hypothetical protein HG530_015189 [Fusarium avenaceum]|nr:hypothetical protein HG530_015189 [Fusarium avenaceum]
MEYSTLYEMCLLEKSLTLQGKQHGRLVRQMEPLLPLLRQKPVLDLHVVEVVLGLGHDLLRARVPQEAAVLDGRGHGLVPFAAAEPLLAHYDVRVLVVLAHHDVAV